MLVDVLVLALLYAIRVIGGAVSVQVPVSEWLLAFSLFVFTSLALVKRYTELAVRLDQSLPDPSNRNYRVSDLPVILGLAAASGFNAITVFSLYVASDAVQQLYQQPNLLWMVCPILLYWIGRIILMAHRRLIHDDPVVFAITDGPSQLAVAAMVVCFVLAII
jgi:4-hydroxybenzoate polyprenyltransferase